MHHQRTCMRMRLPLIYPLKECVVDKRKDDIIININIQYPDRFEMSMFLVHCPHWKVFLVTRCRNQQNTECLVSAPVLPVGLGSSLQISVGFTFYDQAPVFNPLPTVPASPLSPLSASLSVSPGVTLVFLLRPLLCVSWCLCPGPGVA